ncbi:EPIDERMAL PATTERNING FACTOR-like protein 2 [Pyrus ussuriensis x Pyrus communis]|uniref:Epidermal patterning factor-like protein n=1 Tax=Pyrus ussuriensis x Pyrus communis TaxID=2448454 RepID=A0A5N5HP25_9ROSA|nr:EPIDERMAL PATTERNING FACTOR-like protein 2 [Pyrus ussuriensis x Pyrus communis]
MGGSQNCIFCHKNRNIYISILLFLVSSSTHLIFMAEGGRPISSKPGEFAPARVLQENKAGVAVSARQIGSVRPSCERRCSACGRCVAVQVPVTPQVNEIRSHGSSSSVSPKNVAYSRGDDITNYKPMSWKCKCGNLLYNP